jgi:hypothetical protein
MGDPAKDSNGNFVDSAGNVAQTSDGQKPVGDQRVVVLKNGVQKKGWWDGDNFVEDKDSAA